MSDDNWMNDSAANRLLIALICAYVVLIVVVLPAIGLGIEASEPYVDESQEWCDERNGTLVNVLALGHHGGLHCELPNGTSVHMNEVIGPDD